MIRMRRLLFMVTPPLTTVDGIVLHLANKGNRQHPWQPAAPLILAEGMDTDDHSFVRDARLGTVGTKQAAG